jgi:hypothetical protein
VFEFWFEEREVAYEVDTDGRDVGLGIGIVGESQQQARLADTGVSDEEELEEVVVSKITELVSVTNGGGERSGSGSSRVAGE